MALFNYSHSITKDDGMVVDYYVPTGELYVDGLQLESNVLQIKRCKVVNLTVHKNTDLWRVYSQAHNILIELSGSHSLIVEENGKLIAISPCELRGNLSSKYLIHYKDNQIHKYPLSEFNIYKIKDSAITYDFSLEGGNTFIANDVLVMDTVTAFLPQTEESQKELRDICFTHIFNPTTGSFKYELSWDSVYGLYTLTKDEAKSPALSKTNISYNNFEQLKDYLIKHPDKIDSFHNTTIKHQKVTLTLGRLLVNLITPQHYTKIINKPLDKKEIQNILDECAKLEMSKFNQVTNTLRFLYDLSQIGNTFCTIFNINFNMEFLEELEKKIEPYIKDLKKQNILSGLKTIDEAVEVTKKIIKKENPELYYSITSGARGSWDDVQQLFVCKGYVADINGIIIDTPVTSSLSKGLNNEEYYTASLSGRKGIVDRVLNTAQPGYLLRQLCIALNHLQISESDCKTKDGLKVTITEENSNKFIGKYTVDGVLLEQSKIGSYIGKTVTVRSPMFCQSTSGICKKCYGDSINVIDSKYIGLVAAQALGERMQQTMLRTFHTSSFTKKIKQIPKLVPDYLKTIIVQSEDSIKMTAKENIIRFILIAKDCKYTVKGSNVIVDHGEIKIITSNSTEILNFNDDYALIELYPDAINTNENLSVLADDKNENSIVLTFNKKQDIIGKVLIKTVDISTSISKIRKAFSGDIEFIDAHDCYQKFYKLLEPYVMLSTNLEVVLSEMLRCADDDDLLWRLNKDKSITIIPIKDIPSKHSSLVSVSFEDIGKSITNTLSVKHNENETSPLENIIKGNFDNI